MPINCDELLAFARDCVERDDEVGYRNAISRAYYSAYHSVYPVLDNGPKDSHQGLIDYLKSDAWRGNEKYEKQTLIAIVYMLKSLKDSRIIADYRLEASEGVSKHNAEESVELASRVHSKVSEMTSLKLSSLSK